MSDLYNIVCITTVADTPEDIMRLQRAFVELADCLESPAGKENLKRNLK